MKNKADKILNWYQSELQKDDMILKKNKEEFIDIIKKTKKDEIFVDKEVKKISIWQRMKKVLMGI